MRVAVVDDTAPNRTDSAGYPPLTAHDLTRGAVNTEAQMEQRLQNYVKRQGSQKAAAEKLGISVSYMSGILSGTRPIPNTVLKQLGFERVMAYRALKAKG